jgi:hypothetical protein
MHTKIRLFLLTLILALLLAVGHSYSQPDHDHSIKPKAFAAIESDLIQNKIDYQTALLEKFYFSFNNEKLNKRYLFKEEIFIKCGTPLIQEYNLNKNILSAYAVNEIENLLNRPFLKTQDTKTFISPSGKFELTYNTTGTDAVPLSDLNGNSVSDYVEWIADYFDYSWTYTIDTLGQLAPKIGSGRYQIGFENMFYYGYTNNISDTLTRIVMHNNFSGFPPNTDPEGNQKGAAKVTAIHEFKHAVQYTYNSWYDPGWFIEMDATWMEDIGYDYVNDYYNYLSSSQITSPGRSFISGQGYEDCLWLHYISQKHGVNSNKQLWERRMTLRVENIFTAFNEILKIYSTNYETAIQEYFLWNLFTGTRNQGLFPTYKEASAYPSASLCMGQRVLPDSGAGCSISSSAANYLMFKGNESNVPLHFQFWGNQFGKPKIYFILFYKDGTNELIHIDVPPPGNLDYLHLKQISEIDYFYFIPIMTTTVGSNYAYQFKAGPYVPVVFSHTPLKDIEDFSEREVIVNIFQSHQTSVIDSLKLHFSINKAQFQSVQMVSTGIEGEYAAHIPELSQESNIDYYFSIYDTYIGNLFYPDNAPYQYFSYSVGADQIAPSITLNPINSLSSYHFPYTMYIAVNDNQGVDSVYIQYSLNQGEWIKENLEIFTGDIYSIKFQPPINVSPGDRIDYILTVVDIAKTPNAAKFPNEGFGTITITDGFAYSKQPNKTINSTFSFGTRDTIDITDNIMINDIDIFFEAEHGNFSQLTGKIITPERKHLTLFTRPGVNSGYPNAANPKIFFDQESYLSIDSMLLKDPSLAEGRFKPDPTDLNTLYGQDAKGKWIFVLTDLDSDKIGILKEWGLIIGGSIISSTATEENVIPEDFVLHQNYPNPFNPETKIVFDIARGSNIRLTIYDILGREVVTLLDEFKPAGSYSVNFNAKSAAAGLASGVYFYRLTIHSSKLENGTRIFTRKMILMQ